MPDPGGDPGRDPPDDMGPSEEEEVEDLTVGPGPGEDVDVYRQKIIDRFRAIGRAEEKLNCLKAEHKNFRAKYFQAWSRNRSAMKPELQRMEEKVKEQSLLLDKLKERSGAFVEKPDNERFTSQTSVDQESQVMDDPGPSASAPLPPCQGWESPAATSQGVGSEHGTLAFIQQMESPLRDEQRSYKPVLVEKSQCTKQPSNMSAPPAAESVADQKELCKQAAIGLPSVDMEGKSLTEMSTDHQSNVDGSAPNTPDMDFTAPVSAVTCSASENATSKMTASSKEFASPGLPCDPEMIDSGGGGAAHSAACGVVTAMEVSSIDSPVAVTNPPLQSSAESSVLMEENRPASTSAAVRMDSAVKTSGTLNIPASIENDNVKAVDVLVVGGGEGVNISGKNKNDISPPAQQKKDFVVAQTNPESVQSVSAGTVTCAAKQSDLFPAGRIVGSYAAVLGGRTKEGGGNSVNSSSHNLGRFGGGLVGGYRRRNVVQLKWQGEGTPPVRGRVAELVLEMGFKAVDIFALICPVGSYEFDLSFVKAEGLDVFWERYRRCKDLQQWSGLVPKVVSRQPLVKSVTILVRNESIPEADLVVWLRRYGEVLTPLRKVLDEHGIWTGAWTVSLKLKVWDNVVQHLPCSAFLGRDRLTIFYQGQPKVCNKCGEKGHFASSCTHKKCSLCQDLGHLARECTQIRCNLCQQLGHPYSQCPQALHNLPGLETELQRLDKEDEAAEAREETVVAPFVSVVSDSVSPGDVVPESVPPVVVPNPIVRRSSRLAEAAGGAGLADLPSRPLPPPVPAPQHRKRDQESAGVLDGGGVDGVEGGASISHVSPSVEVSDDEGWEMFRRRKKKMRKRSKVTVSSSEPDPGGVPLGNAFSVLSGDEMSELSLSSMDEGETRSLKRAVSGDESVVEVKKRLPQSS